MSVVLVDSFYDANGSSYGVRFNAESLVFSVLFTSSDGSLRLSDVPQPYRGKDYGDLITILQNDAATYEYEISADTHTPFAYISLTTPLVPPPPACDLDITGVVVTGETVALNDGTATVTATSTAGSIVYGLDGVTYPNSTGIFTALPSGYGTIYAKDANNCTDSIPYDIPAYVAPPVPPPPVFEYPLINPIRLVPVVSTNPRYNTTPFDLAFSKECYCQKFTTLDNTVIEFLTDYMVLVEVKRMDNSVYLTPTIIPLPYTFEGQTYTACTVPLDFTTFEAGEYYIELTYTDDTSTLITLQSGCIEVLDALDKSIVIEYTNSENDFGFVFEDGITPSLRVEGEINLFDPRFDDTTYTDEINNVTSLYSMPFRTFKLYINKVPDWYIDLINRALSCDQIKIDGQYYAKTEGAKWEAVRGTDGYDLSGWNIEIQPTENRFTERLNLKGRIVTNERYATNITLGESGFYTFTGNVNRSWVLPPSADNIGATYYIKCEGSGTLTINTTSAENTINDVSGTLIHTINYAQGNSLIIHQDGLNYQILSP